IGPGGLAGPVALDGAALAEIDTAAALLVWRHLAAAGVSPEAVSVRRFADAHARILEMVRQRPKGLEPAAAPPPRGPLASLAPAPVDGAPALQGPRRGRGAAAARSARVAGRGDGRPARAVARPPRVLRARARRAGARRRKALEPARQGVVRPVLAGLRVGDPG